MLLSRLLLNLPDFQIFGSTNIEISDIVDNSRNVKKESLFVAIKGLTVDSHKFIPQAIEAGATAIIGEEEVSEVIHLEVGQKITYIQVKNSRHALGVIASDWFNNPSKKLKVIGVTGTEGKTTTSNLIYHILQSTGHKAGLISTINARIGEKTIDTGLHVTNPEALPLQELLKRMVDDGCEYAVLETTSLGLHQGRVAGVDFEVGVLTNITSDHLDYHKTLEDYREAKAQLFKKVKAAVLNKDDNSFEFIEGELHKNTKIYSYGIDKNADIKAENIELNHRGAAFDVYYNGETVKATTSLIGKYNISNTLAAVGTVIACGISLGHAVSNLKTFTSIEGRLERIDEGQKFEVFVDFAHTANSIKSVLETLREVTPKDKRLIAVYGSAGLRDAEKRPEMGLWGGKLADITIFTTDDPRTEDVNLIIDKMADGALNAGAEEVEAASLARRRLARLNSKHVFTRIVDRKQAIEKALSLAKEGDVVALLGKGHEKSLAVGKEEIPWSDQEVAREILNSKI